MKDINKPPVKMLFQCNLYKVYIFAENYWLQRKVVSASFWKKRPICLFLLVLATRSSCCLSYLQSPFWPCNSGKCKSKPLRVMDPDDSQGNLANTAGKYMICKLLN